ncbi:rna-directed dna polymerase from mobile element jockey-like [Pitangus sulphuratus]|nr:rna-directed dna polymerase from mobile element jockey-like [Pitangus sulphuratus]
MKANVTCIFKKGENSGNYRLISLTSIHGKLTKQLIVETICRHIKDKNITRSNQHGFTEAKSCLHNVINFYDEMTGLVDEGRTADIVYLDFVLDQDSFKMLKYSPENEELEGIRRYQDFNHINFITLFDSRDPQVGIKYTLNQFVDNTKLSRSVELLEGRKVLQSGLDRLDPWANSNGVKFHKAKTSPALWPQEPQQHYKLGEE